MRLAGCCLDGYFVLCYMLLCLTMMWVVGFANCLLILVGCLPCLIALWVGLVGLGRWCFGLGGGCCWWVLCVCSFAALGFICGVWLLLGFVCICCFWC